MSTVFAPPTLDELLILPLPLLQPAAAMAIAAMAPIAGVRLNCLPLVELTCPAATERADRSGADAIAMHRPRKC